jgi:hypothetical protein
MRRDQNVSAKIGTEYFEQRGSGVAWKDRKGHQH